MSWTDERVALLRKMWAAGLSCSQIASELECGITRNAVIGKVHRLGLSGRKLAPTAARLEPRPRPAPRAQSAPRSAPVRHSTPLHGAVAKAAAREKPGDLPPRPFKSMPIPAAIPAPDASLRCTLLELNDKRCKWPLGDPASPDFRYCGSDKAVTDGPYCRFHFRIAYVPQGPRKTMSEAHRAAIENGKRQAARARQMEASGWL